MLPFPMKMAGNQDISTIMTSYTDNATMTSPTMDTENITLLLTAQTTEASYFSGGNVQFKTTMKKVSDNLLIAIVCVVMASLGCTIELKVLKAHFRRPIGLIIGLVCQFILFPLITFGLAHALQLEKWHAVGMILLGTAPGGHVSNILTYYCNGEVTLSVSMTAISTLVALGMMPLNCWIYSRSWVDQDTVIPYKSILIGLACMLVPVAIGMLILVKFPRIAKWLMRIGSSLGMLMIIGVLVMNSYLYPHVFLSGWGVWVASGLLPLLGLTIGYIAATIFRQPHPSRRAIAIETSCQNVALTLGLITISYGPGVYLKVLVFPELFGTLGVDFLLILCAIYNVQKLLRRRLSLKETKQQQLIDGEYNVEKYGNEINCYEKVQAKGEKGASLNELEAIT